MAALNDEPSVPVEITWIVCERCGALSPRVEQSWQIKSLGKLCCCHLRVRWCVGGVTDRRASEDVTLDARITRRG